ncbi:glycosyltransferase [Brevibacterium luteolum]|nr:glycosyltransferase [Brevibacterium luteolum]
MTAPPVSVIIPYYENPAGLTAVLAGISAQDYTGDIEIIVADDGSATAPEVPAGVRLVRQDDRGFRAAAARNLGAAHASGTILVFLDGDTIPQPGCITALAEALVAEPWTLAVGSRRMLDTGTTPPADLGEPAWLTRAWADTADLQRIDDTGFRFIISAVLALTRELFDTIGGFDAGFIGYGGEDWELAWQARLAGADYRHLPHALAHHLGGDWAHRWGADTAGKRAEKNAESMALAASITHPIMRPAGIVFAVPDILVHLPGSGDVGCDVAAITALLAAGDVHVVCTAPKVPVVFASDPRVHATVPAWTRARPRFEVRAHRAFCPEPGELQTACEDAAAAQRCALVADAAGHLLAEIRPARAVALAARGLGASGQASEPQHGTESVLRLVRQWPVPAAPLSLEDTWRQAAEETQAGC